MGAVQALIRETPGPAHANASQLPETQPHAPKRASHGSPTPRFRSEHLATMRRYGVNTPLRNPARPPTHSSSRNTTAGVAGGFDHK